MVAIRPRDKRGCFQQRKENERREKQCIWFKRNAEELSVIVESDGRHKGFLLTGRRVVQLDVLAKALYSGCQTC